MYSSTPGHLKAPCLVSVCIFPEVDPYFHHSSTDELIEGQARHFMLSCSVPVYPPYSIPIVDALSMLWPEWSWLRQTISDPALLHWPQHLTVCALTVWNTSSFSWLPRQEHCPFWAIFLHFHSLRVFSLHTLSVSISQKSDLFSF